MTQSGQSERPVTLVAKFNNRSRFSICSDALDGTGRFPSMMAGFEFHSGRICIDVDG
jgi:hypothetical protein